MHILKKIVLDVFYLAFSIIVIFLWLLVDYAYRSGDERLLRIFRIVGIASFALVGLIDLMKYVRKAIQQR